MLIDTIPLTRTEEKMNMPIGMDTLGGLSESRIQSKIHELALKMASELGIKEGELSIILDDSEIHGALQKKAQAVIKEEDERRKQEVLSVVRKHLGIGDKKPEKVSESLVRVISQQPIESTWQKYLKEKECSVPSSFAQLKTSEEVSAARGFLISVLNRYRRSPIWTDEQLGEAVGIWHKKVQMLLGAINNFFGKKEDIPIASGEVYFRVSVLLESDKDLRWFMDGPAGIQAELEAKRKEQELAQQRTIERQQRKEILEAKKQEIIRLLVAGNVSPEDAEKLAGATVKKFPELKIEEAMLKMAINRQVAAIQKSREFLAKIAPEAKPYLSGSRNTEKEFLSEVLQHPEVKSILKRDANDARVLK